MNLATLAAVLGIAAALMGFAALVISAECQTVWQTRKKYRSPAPESQLEWVKERPMQTEDFRRAEARKLLALLKEHSGEWVRWTSLQDEINIGMLSREYMEKYSDFQYVYDLHSRLWVSYKKGTTYTGPK